MKFTLNVEIDESTTDPSRELKRILRYWSTHVTNEDVRHGKSMNVYDSDYQQIGQWKMVDPKQEKSEKA